MFGLPNEIGAGGIAVPRDVRGGENAHGLGNVGKALGAFARGDDDFVERVIG